jgi:hypothetical protein
VALLWRVYHSFLCTCLVRTSKVKLPTLLPLAILPPQSSTSNLVDQSCECFIAPSSTLAILGLEDMGRFTWTQGHQKQPSDKIHALPEWFSKSAGEPSRQALSELIKERSPPSSTFTRSRTNTVSSKISREAQSSTDQSSFDANTRPPSRSSIMEEPQISPQRQERMSKHFLSKGSRMMRRQTSRLNMLTSSTEDSRAAGLARVRSAGHLLNLHTKRSEQRPQISGPFDFQHVSHADQSQYQDLSKADPSHLADSFSALQADQEPGLEIKGIPVADLPSTASSGDQSRVSRPQSPTFSIVPSLPSTPPKPAPPPKDLHLRLPSLGGDIRISRSMENFSWPTRSPQIDSGDSFGTESTSFFTEEGSASHNSSIPSPQRMPQESNAVSASAPASPRLLPPVTADLLDKPLPQPPTVVHAVSTVDDSTLMMKVAPLPQVPQGSLAGEKPTRSMLQLDNHKLASPPLPHQTPPQTTRFSRRRSQSSSEIPLASTFASTAAIVATPPRCPRQSKRISVGIKKIDIDDWEDAIDYSWDHAFDGDDDLDEKPEAITKSDILPQTSYAFAPQRTSSTTRLQSFGPLNDLPIRTTKSDLNLQGLGIGSTRPESGFAAAPEYEEYSEKHESLKVPFVRREPGSPISKSSSQESIILSIASSIMSNHRSSSSTSLGDLESIKDEDTLPQTDSKKLVGGSGSISSSETVTTDRKSGSVPVSSEDTLEELPNTSHQRGPSASRLPFVKSTTRQRSSTQSSNRKLNSRASYSLFPTASSVTTAN